MPRLDLIILPLLAGYLFLITFNITKFYHQRIEKQRLIFNSLVAAFLIAVIGYLFDYIVLKSVYVISYRNAASNLITEITNLKVPGLKHSILFFLISYPLGFVLNLIFWRKFSFAYTVEKWGNQIERLFWFSLNQKQDENKLLMLTTKSNKVYIGYVSKISEPIGETYITIIPNFSGYRNKENLKLEITTNYTDVIERYVLEDRASEIDKLGIILPVSEILIVSKFDIEIFGRFNENDNEEIQVNYEEPIKENSLKNCLIKIIEIIFK
nr:hypothetical protein [uncultured Flavobacterium sp.]